MGFFVFCVAILGGSSRPDAAQLLILRPLSALFLVYGLYHVSKSDVSPFRIPLALLLGLTLIFILQLIPLPPALWTSLPGRQEVVDLGTAVGMTDIWRPMSLVPSRTANTLAAMLVPISALLFFAIQKQKHREQFFLLIGGLAVLSAAIGLFQVLSGADSHLFFYDITNNGSAVGFFANRNHNAVFLVIGLFGLTHFSWLRQDRTSSISAFDLLVLFASIIVLVIILINGSRAGLLCLGIFTVCAAFIFLLSNQENKDNNKRRRQKGARLYKIIAPLLFGLLAISVVALFFLMDRITAINRLLENDVSAGLRYQAISVFKQLIETYWIFGSGFGSFEYVYRMYEPSSLLIPSYFNQAHNDWVQIVIEGGLPAIAVFVLFAIWLMRRFYALVTNPTVDMRHFAFWLGLFGTIGAASLFDYPLRTPLFQMICVWLVALFAIQSDKVKE